MNTGCGLSFVITTTRSRPSGPLPVSLIRLPVPAPRGIVTSSRRPSSSTIRLVPWNDSSSDISAVTSIGSSRAAARAPWRRDRRCRERPPAARSAPAAPAMPEPGQEVVDRFAFRAREPLAARRPRRDSSPNIMWKKSEKPRRRPPPVERNSNRTPPGPAAALRRRRRSRSRRTARPGPNGSRAPPPPPPAPARE